MCRTLSKTVIDGLAALLYQLLPSLLSKLLFLPEPSKLVTFGYSN